jgi:hypothetical protein
MLRPEYGFFAYFGVRAFIFPIVITIITVMTVFLFLKKKVVSENRSFHNYLKTFTRILTESLVTIFYIPILLLTLAPLQLQLTGSNTFFPDVEVENFLLGEFAFLTPVFTGCVIYFAVVSANWDFTPYIINGEVQINAKSHGYVTYINV